MGRRLGFFWSDEVGQDMLEYMLILMLVVVLAVGSLTILGRPIPGIIMDFAGAL